MYKLGILLIVVGCSFSCNTGKEERKTSTAPRIKKKTKLESPAQNQTLKRGDEISFEISSKNHTIDSVTLKAGEVSFSTTASNFRHILPTKKVGIIKIRLTAHVDGEKETHFRNVIVLPEKAPKILTYEVINTFTHQKEDFTQGLLISGGNIYESTGQRGRSSVKKKNIKSGETLQQTNLPSNVFGEGLALLNNEFFQLTYTSGQCLVYNQKLEKIRSHKYQGEGWGLTAYQDKLLMTDGSEKIYIRNSQNFSIIDELHVYDNTGKCDSLNELEIVNGYLYANVWFDNHVLVIDPQTGAVVQKIDFNGLLTSEEEAEADALNGIAYDQDQDKLYVTGKYWPKLFEVKLISKNLLQ